MKRTLILITVALLFYFTPKPTFAACRVVPPGQSCPAGQFPRTYALTIAGTAQCTSGANGTYNVCCDFQTEANSVDSVRAPMCGSSEERGKANATCWDCGGGTYKCDGLDFALGNTDPFISQIRNPVQEGDTNTDQVWRIPNASIPSTFTYNGQEYDKPSGDLIVCGPNNLACGSSEECTNITYPEINNRGRSGSGQCQTYSFTGIKLAYAPSQTPPAGTPSPSKACINIGDYSSHFNELSQAAGTFPNGWIYILALPEWMDSISAFIKDHPNNTFMIRLHHPNAILSADYADRWVNNLKSYAGNINTKVYLMPVNEPNNTAPDRHVDVNTVKIFVSAIAQGLDNDGLLNTKYILTSPMIDPTSSDVTGYLTELCAEGFCEQFSAVAVAPYGVQGGTGLLRGDMSEIKKYFRADAPIIAAETGVSIPGQGVVYAPEKEAIASYLTDVKPTWDAQQVIAACVFSYNPDTHSDQGWIYQAQNVQNALNNLGQSITPIAATPATPKAVRSTISYESCTVAGAPKISSKTRIPNLKQPGYSDNKKFSVTGVNFPQFTRLKGIISLFGNVLKYPDMSGFARMLDGAMPALQPLNIQKDYQKIAHPLTITADAKVCVESEDGEVRARPIKNDVQTEYKELNKLVGATPFFASILGLQKLSKYEQTNMAQLHPDLVPAGGRDDCPDPPQARNVREMAGPSGGAEFSEPEEKSARYGTPSRWIPQDILNAIARLLCVIGGSANCRTDFDPQYYLNLDLNTPYLNNVNDDVGVNNQTGKHTGFVNSFVPGKLQDALGNDPGKVFHKLNQNLGSNSEPVDINLNYVNAEGIQQHERFLKCSVSPQSKQTELGLESCQFTDVRVPNTSDWAQATGTSGGPPAFTPSGPFAELLKQKAQAYGVPQCVMEGVARIEGGGRYQELPLDQCLQTTNTCSAVGPMQFTVGPGHGKATEEACKNSCGAGYCPNAWSTWGNGGNPCRYEDALDATARYLAAFGHFSGGDLKQSIHDAATAYYGSDSDETARGYLNGCEYWEFVYQQCNPQYECQKQKAR